jgi:hypothetical protein
VTIPLYPNVHVELTGEDGNAFSVLNKVSRALRRAEGTAASDAFMEEATKGDYDHLLQTCFKFVDVE